MTPDPLRTTKAARTEPRPAMAREEIFALVAAKLDRVGRRFDDGLNSKVGIVSEMGSHISTSGGKRLRPALLLLASGLVGYRGEDDVTFGAVFEFIHTATLVHDDIIDEAATRRGRESLNHRWGNHLTVLMGDHLYIKAMQLAIAAGNLRILELLADITLRMIEGELIQGHQNGRIDIDEAEHLDVVERKTAALFSGCCRVPAMLAHAGHVEELALSRYGLDLGMAYQLIDDLLDLMADEKTLGKPTASDLREGKLTLPLIHLLRRGDASHREMVRTVVNEHGFERVSREQILSVLGETGCLEEARIAAGRYAARARTHLLSFPEGPYKEALLSIPEFVLDRDR